MNRRDFLASVGVSMALAVTRSRAENANRRPRLLISHTDPFTGLALLKSRYESGQRPSVDMEGWALSWLLTNNGQFAEKALAAMRSSHIGKGNRPSRSWVDYARWSMAFDWLFDYP